MAAQFAMALVVSLVLVGSGACDASRTPPESIELRPAVVGGAPGAGSRASGGTSGLNAVDSGLAPVDAGRLSTSDAGRNSGATAGRAGAAPVDDGDAGESRTTLGCAGDAGTAFYIDARGGRDSNAGTSPAAAWQTLARVNAETLMPGTTLCFKAGEVWTGQLAPKGSGTATHPIVVDQYGTGARPRIAAGRDDAQALLLMNVRYWEINHLELTNDQPGPGDYRGISVRGKDAGELSHIYIRDCFVHDVTGQVNWIGGDSADDQPPWIKFKTGWDRSKRTGGVVFEVESETGVKTWFDDVMIERNVVQNTSFGGIIFKQLEASYGWGVRNSASDTKFSPHTNIVVRDNYIDQKGTKYGCNAIYMTGAKHVLIERNVADGAGTSAIEAYNADDVLIQYNETFGTISKAKGADSNGIDADRATTNTIIQYNYVHGNGDGILLCQFAFGDSIVRYNLILDNSRHGINLHSDASATNQTYNNLIVSPASANASLIATSGNGEHLKARYAIRNNILRARRAGAQVVSGAGVSYNNNLFDGIAAVGGGARTGDVMFVNEVALPSGSQAGSALSDLQGWQLRPGSPALEHGVEIENHGEHDFWGNPLYKGAPDIGPYEAP